MQHVARILLAATVAATACSGRDTARPGTETGSAEGAPPAAVAPAAPEGFKIANVMIGKRIGDKNMITEPTFQFAPADTVYVSVGTTGKSDSTSLAAVWHFQDGKMLDSTAQTIRPSGPENTEFHLTRPKGWAPGTYRVTIYSDGDSVDAKTFAVKK
jgi:hypothetical protein